MVPVVGFATDEARIACRRMDVDAAVLDSSAGNLDLANTTSGGAHTFEELEGEAEDGGEAKSA